MTNYINGMRISSPFVLLPAGPWRKAGRDVPVSIPDLDQAIENFEADQAAGVEIGFDYDHRFATRGDSRASGWLRKLFRRGSELWAQVEWTEAARKAIERGEYRSVSAEFARDHELEDGTRRGFSIVGGALTNRPHIRNLTVAFSADRAAAAQAYLAQVEEAIESGDFHPDTRLHLRAVRLMVEQDLDYNDAAAAAWRELR